MPKDISSLNNWVVKVKGVEIGIDSDKVMLANMDISSFNEIEGLEKIEHYFSLNLRNNKIRSIPQVNYLYRVENLSLANNLISSMEGFNGAINLKRLNLYGNKINEVSHLDKCLFLKHLSLGNNKIKKITGLENLKHLEDLSIDHNKIKVIEGLEHLVSLKRLKINDNNIDSSIIEALGGLDENGFANSPQEFVRYCAKKRGIFYL